MQDAGLRDADSAMRPRGRRWNAAPMGGSTSETAQGAGLRKWHIFSIVRVCRISLILTWKNDSSC
eukprot:6210467-Pleurochrysis_carterae.AAC.1